jgi:flagellar basal-body rod protein FlgF
VLGKGCRHAATVPSSKHRKATKNLLFHDWHGGCKGGDQDETTTGIRPTMTIANSIALSSQMALETQMDVLSNNIANQSTPGYKSEEIDFTQYLQQDGTQSDAYVQTTGTSRDLHQGPISNTGNQLDVALKGPGFISVKTATGVEYTRNGQLQLDNQNELVTAAGYPVLNSAGQPIVLPTGTTNVTIAQDGTVSNGKGVLGQLGVVNFDQPGALVPAGGGLFVTDQTAQPATGTKVLQGMIEGSNVEPIIAMTRLMAAARSVGSIKDFVTSQATLEQNAIQTLGKVV